MEYNVAQLLKEQTGAERRYHFEEEGQDARYLKEVDRVEGDVKLLRLTGSILVSGKIKATVQMTCGRCLEPMRQEVAVEFKEEYYPLVDVSSGVHLPSPEDPSAFMIGPDHILDLREALRQYTLIALPMKPVCRPDCKGLCSQCGANLNQGPCRCPAPEPDARLEALAKLKSKLR